MKNNPDVVWAYLIIEIVSILLAVSVYVRPAKAQLLPGDKGAVVRLLRQRAGVPCAVADPADDTLVEAVRGHAGAPPGQISKVNVRKALVKVAGEPAARLAVWLDEGEWIAGTTPAQKAAIRVVLRHPTTHLEDVVLGAARDVLPRPTATPPSPIEALAGAEDTATPLWQEWEQSAAMLARALAPILLSRLDTGVWPANLPPEQRAALQARLGEVDLLDVVRHLGP